MHDNIDDQFDRSSSRIQGSVVKAIVCLGIAAVAFVVAYEVQKEMKGPQFLLFYAVAFAVSYAAAWAGSRSDASIAVWGLVIFEGIGLIRLVYGALHGMHRFVFMIAGMIIGGWMFAAVISKSNN